MSQAFAIKHDSQQSLFYISGELTLATAKQVLKEADALFRNAATWNIDLAQVSRSDSAGLALLVAWMRQAKVANKAIRFYHIPAQMLAIAQASGLDDILPQ